jgi:oxazoline/thiazoline synthase
MNTLTFKRHLVPYVVPDEAVYLVSERGVSAVQGELAAALAPLLDGTRAADEIVRDLADRYPAARVRRALEQLVRAGRVASLNRDADRQQAAYWELGGLDGDRALRRVDAATVRIETHGDVDAAPFADALEGAGLRVAPDADSVPALTLVLADDYLQPALEAANAAALATGAPWLLARPTGSVVWVGPLFRPGETGCWTCLRHRLAANRQALTYLQERLDRTEPLTGAGRLPVTVELGARLVALEAAKFVAGVRPADAHVLTFDTLALATERHELIRRPQCPDCGDRTLQEQQNLRPVAFTSQLKAFTADGGHRTKSPEDVLARYGRQVSPITGVVTSLVPFTDGPPMLKVYTAGQNLARQVDELRSLRTSLRSLSCGKGMTDTQARASAVCESIERYSGVFQGDEARTRATYRELEGDALHPDTCLLYSERQYRDQAKWNATGSGFNVVSDRFDEDARVDWSPLWSVSQGRTRWLPTSYLYYGYPKPAGRFPLHADSNGNAAGTSLEDAVLQGFLELVERDSVALWWYNRVRRPAVDLASFGERYVDDLVAAYAAVGHEVWALDLTSDFGIPAVGAFSRRTDRPVEDILIAFGAHLDPRIAVLRALTELNQFLPAVINSAGNGRDGYLAHSEELVDWWSTATLENQPHLVPDPHVPARTPGSWPVLASHDLADDLDLALRLVEQRGMELLVLEQTRPDIGLPVAKVVVPGMRHFWARLAPGRLYDVPVELGWLDRPTREEDVNPIPIFI